ncbi:GNAT family N-acetyltransferase [Tianweitania populi]|uniref:Ribosomal-protein-alanine N-acetyltransferase n=1 Tax=Tianweitania populi TaxID=1607949 RepID=A0A8J3DKV7_9HYPH|nr:GNAT family N-acetyltransferase [Tianweitania populi]GHD06002.1 ribosomal-protein-alanine N-acetyltransferase [Tianweitania populi]
MLALPFAQKATPVLKGERITLRLPVGRDYEQWAALRQASRSFLEPWEPLWSVDELERSGWRYRLERNRTEFKTGSGIGFLVIDNAENRVTGGITMGNIRRGVAQTCQIGYWMGENYSGRGYMLDALNLVIPFAFRELRLHRIEAACIPSNARSVRVLEKAGFTREGLARSYLRINGAWQDHLLYGLVCDDARS